METRKRVYVDRRYRHICPANSNAESQITAEICPDCGQRGEFYGFFQGTIDRMAKRSLLVGFSANAGHTAFLPKMFDICPRCNGEGIAVGEDFDYECPDCNGLGGLLTLDKEQMRKIRRWVTWRLNRKDAGEGRARPKERGQKNHGEPPNPVFTRDIEALVRAINAQMAYSRQYAARNEHIGGWMLQCDDHGWKIFMELIESWDEAGRQMEVVGNAIQLKASARKNSAVLITLYPPEDGQAQHLVVSGSGGHIPIDERFSLQDAWDLINLALTAGGV